MNEHDRRNISWLAAVERNPDAHSLNPGHHLHALFADVLEIHRTTHFKRWANQWGVNKIERVRNPESARNYMLKYVLKDGGMIEWQEAGELWRYRHPATP